MAQAAFLVDEESFAIAQRNAQKGVSLTRRKKRQLYGCDRCGLYRDVASPKMEPSGKGRLGIMMVGESPGRNEDDKGTQFVGRSGQFLAEVCAELDLSLRSDFILNNAIQCNPPDENKKRLLGKWMQCCAPRLERQINEYEPEAIIAFGADAIKAVLNPPFEVKLKKLRGLGFPSQKYGCWVGCCYHPSYVVRTDEGFGPKPSLVTMFKDDLEAAVSLVDKPMPKKLDRENNHVLLTVKDAVEFLEAITDQDFWVSFDFETTGLSAYAKGARILCCSFALEPTEGFWLPVSYGGLWSDHDEDLIKRKLAAFLASDTPKIIQNQPFEQHWSCKHLKTWIYNVVADTMNNAHVVSERRGTTGLDFQTFHATGDRYKDMIDVTDIANEPMEMVVTYSCLDSRYSALLNDKQQAVFDTVPRLRAASDFFRRCAPVLIRSEQRGLALDMEELRKQEDEAESIIEEAEVAIQNSNFVADYFDYTNTREFKPGSDAHMRTLLYDVLRIRPPEKLTQAGQWTVDKDALHHAVKQREGDKEFETFINTVERYRLYSTKLTTFLRGVQKALHDDGLMHPSFLLNWVETYRSSSQDPNFQNLPKRNETQADFRRIIIPHYGNFFLEVDASGSEVAVIAMMSQDPVLTKQISEKVDIHRYWAARLFDKPEDKITKQERYVGKNGLVFPLFYGSYYKSIAYKYDMPEDHVQAVEEEFWSMYRHVKNWQESLFDLYDRRGYIEMPLGFRRHKPLSRNQICNTPVQGTSFHMLLEAMRKTDEEMMRRGMKSVVAAEIHDSILNDIVEEEIEDVLDINVKYMTEKQWAWQGDVPRRCEAMLGENWFDLEEIDLEDAV